jgi:AcrR family transcriptional regulator
MEKIESRHACFPKSLFTQGLILDQTFACLVENGYRSTTLSEVCRRAGISRGTALYHYRSTEDLVIAVLEHALANELRAFHCHISDGGEFTDGKKVMDALWASFSGPAFHVWLEVWVASRTNPALNRRAMAVGRRFSDAVHGSYELRGGGGSVEQSRILAMVKTTFALLTGMSVRGTVPDQMDSMVLLESIKAGCRAAFPEPVSRQEFLQ